jgi:hypothetical protein
MFKDPGMMNSPPEQPDDLERLFAAEEASIRDDGFTQRTVEQARDSNGWRRTAVYGAGMAGFGVAVASLVDLAPHLPKMSGWWNVVLGDVRAAPVADTTLLAAAAIVAGVSFLLVAMVAQDR